MLLFYHVFVRYAVFQEEHHMTEIERTGLYQILSDEMDRQAAAIDNGLHWPDLRAQEVKAAIARWTRPDLIAVFPALGGRAQALFMAIPTSPEDIQSRLDWWNALEAPREQAQRARDVAARQAEWKASHPPADGSTSAAL